MRLTAGLWLLYALGLFGLAKHSVCDDIADNLDVDTSNYHNYTTLLKLFRRLSDENPSLAKLYSIGQSVQERELLVLRISSDLDQIDEKKSDSKDDLSFALNSKPMFKYVANMHGM